MIGLRQTLRRRLRDRLSAVTSSSWAVYDHGGALRVYAPNTATHMATMTPMEGEALLKALPDVCSVDEALDLIRLFAMVSEGQALRQSFDAATAGAKMPTADQLRERSR
jgi:hypothetical protein